MSLLFRLPREVRDQIYLYALYNANGLLYKRCRDCTSKLCLRPGRRSSRRNRFAWLRKAPFDWTVARRKGHQHESNQLKYVCRQLYIETNGLNIRQNLVVLEDACSGNAMEQCVLLLGRWPMLRQISIKCGSKIFASAPGRSKFLEIVEYCVENSHVSVRIHIPYWSQTDPNFVLRGISYLLTLRKDRRLMKRLAQATSISYLSDSKAEVFSVDVELPCNLRWLPTEEKFNQPLFEYAVRKHPMLSQPSAQAAVGDLQKLAKGWFIDGL